MQSSNYTWNQRRIDISRAKQLAMICEKKQTLFRLVYIQDAGHNDIEYEDNFRTDYFINLREFFEDIKARNLQNDAHELEQQFRALSWSSTFNHKYNHKSRAATQYSRPSTQRHQTQFSKSSEVEMSNSNELEMSETSKDLRENQRAISMQHSFHKKHKKNQILPNIPHRSTMAQ